MNKEITLQVPGSLYETLLQKAKEQGVSLEALCLSMLSGGSLLEPTLYSSISSGLLREEIEKVVKSSLPETEIKKRVRLLETHIARHIK